MTTPSLTWDALEHILLHSPMTLFTDWYQSGQLERDLPEIYALYGVPQKAEHHPEIDTGVHTMLVVQQASLLSRDAAVIFAALTHDLGKAHTPHDEWPAHRGHEERGVDPVNTLCDRLSVPPSVRHLAKLVCEDHLECHRAFEMRPGSVVQWLERNDWLNNRKELQDFLLACEADARGRTGFEDREYLSGHYLKQVADIAADVMSDETQTRQIRLQSAISAVKQFFHPFADVESRRDIVRKGANLATPSSSMSNVMC